MPRDDQLYNSYLVQAVRKHPCLYNCNLKEYSNKRLANEAWEIVAEEMNDSVVNCKEKWRNLRIVFSRHLQKSLHGTIPGKAKYYLYEQMEFLKPFVRCRVSQTYLPYADTIEESTENLESDQEPMVMKKEICESEISEKQLEGHFMEPVKSKAIKQLNDVDDFEKQSEDCFDYYMEHPKKRSKYVYDVDQSDIDVTRYDQLNTTNYRMKFLQSLLPDVEEMTPVQFRKFRKKVMNDIEEILEPTLVSTSKSSQ